MKFLEEVDKILSEHPDPVQGLVLACQKFERRVYLSAGAVPLEDYRNFYRLILKHIEFLDPKLFASLDGRTSNIFHRNLDIAINTLPESGSVITRISTLVP